MSARPAFAITQPAFFECQCSEGGTCTCGLYSRCPVREACQLPEIVPPATLWAALVELICWWRK